MIRMLAKVWNAWPLLVLLAHDIAFAQEHSRCQQIPFVSPKEDQPIATADRVEGQLVAAVPEMNGQLASAGNTCMALFELPSGRRIASGSTDSNGAFLLGDRNSGRYVIVVSGSRSPWHLPVRLSLFGAARGSAPARGLLLKLMVRNNRPIAIVASPIANLTLRHELLGMLKVDQAIRKKAIERGIISVSTEIKSQMTKVDSENDARLRGIVTQYGWPGDALVGFDGAGAALTIVQHLSAQTQKQLLPGVEAAYRAGQIPGGGYANLLDHVRLDEGRPQIYGTVAKPFRKGRPIEFFPIEDPANVDIRRKAVGLPPMAVYRKLLLQMYFPTKHE
jgi:hypothetical protein